MSLLRRLAGGIRGLFRRDRLEQELDEELRGYLDLAARDGVRAGLSPEEAARAARVRMGSLDAIKDEVRDAGWEAAFESFWQDVRYGARVLKNHPGFTCAAVLTLALGIGANAALFSVVSAVLLNPLPYPDGDRLVSLGYQSFPDLRDLADQSEALAAAGAASGWALDLVGKGEPRRVDGALIAGDLFPALGVAPLMGRTFSESDGAREPVAVVSHRFWRTELGSDASALERPLTLSGRAYTIVGVMPESFRLPFFSFRSDVWVPLRVAYPEAADARGAHFLIGVGRLRGGVDLGRLQAELNVIGERIGKANPTESRTFTARDLRDSLVGAVRAPLLILLGAVALVLIIACSNFASLLLARSVARAREMHVRHALGATRRRLLRQLLTETALLSLSGAGAGIVLASLEMRLLERLMPGDLPSFRSIGLDGRTLLMTLLVSLAGGMLFGLGPAWHAWRLRASRPSGERTTEGRAPARRVLVVAELALATVLLIGAGLLIRSFWQLRNVTLGFDPDRVLTLRLNLPASRYDAIADQETFLWRLDHDLRQVPGTAAAGLISELPLSGWHMMHNMIVEGQPSVPEGQEPEVFTHEVSPDYFTTMGTPIVLGRGLTDEDTSTSPLVGVVNQAFVRRYSPDRSPLGVRARWARGSPDAWMTIVGVVPDMRSESLDEPQPPTIYTPLVQKQQPWKRWASIVVRSRDAAPLLLADAIKQVVWRHDPALPITEVTPMTEVLSESVKARRFNLVVLSVFAALAMILAAVGVYGVLAHLVAQRSREIGVRMALGAQSSDILRLMMRQGYPLISCGLACGGIGALLVSRVLRTLLYGVSPTDPLTIAAVLAGLALLGCLASLVPAWRAMRVHPATVLRAE
jgi:putative ABC transport system permease protein